MTLTDSETNTHSQKLLQHIKAEIDVSGGKITFARYMELALYAPGLGYYSAGLQKFGKQGDFVTAPEISPLFSRCIAKQCQPILNALGSADILEFGAGSGVMAADILLELEKQACLPDHYFILEISPDLRERQQNTLKERVPSLINRVQWLDRLPAFPFRGILLANEVMDAMPVHRFRVDESIQEFYVCWENDALHWHLDAPSSIEFIDTIRATIPSSFTDYESEINSLLPGWISSIGQLLETGMVLLIDYGFPHHEYYHPTRNRGTLMCHHQHRAHADPLILVGLQDITAHVDFTCVAENALAAGLTVAGYTSQAAFLLSLGVTEMNSDIRDTKQQLQLSQQLKLLTLPTEMGELFKVIALTKNIHLPLEGFTLQDRRNRL